MATTRGVETTADREIVLTRIIDGPRSLVFEVFTREEHLARWWGPHGFRTTTHSFEFRPGGVWSFNMHGPDGTDYPNRIEWREIVPPERLVYLHGESAGDAQSFTTTVTFVERANATEVTLRAVFRTKEQRDHAVEQYGAIEGGKQTLDRLAGYIAELR
jgi:uncharacterized protein YndB with AHSA1/START domain